MQDLGATPPPPPSLPGPYELPVSCEASCCVVSWQGSRVVVGFELVEPGAGAVAGAVAVGVVAVGLAAGVGLASGLPELLHAASDAARIAAAPMMLMCRTCGSLVVRMCPG